MIISDRYEIPIYQFRGLIDRLGLSLNPSFRIYATDLYAVKKEIVGEYIELTFNTPHKHLSNKILYGIVVRKSLMPNGL